MKFLFLLSLYSLPAFSAPCEVYGISDSPQHLSCKLGFKKLELTCREGTYYLGEEKVETAYHLEVEDGPTPLVFKTAMSELTVLMKSETRMEAELGRGSKKSRGRCRP